MILRNYGLPDSEAIATPTWSEAWPSTPCPNCGAKVCQVEVKVKQGLVRGGEGMSRYMGCPACPWASPAVVASIQLKEGE